MEHYTENIGLLNALTPNNCQAITQSNVHKYVWRYMTSVAKGRYGVQLTRNCLVYGAL